MIDSAGHAIPMRVMVLAPNWLGDVVMHTSLLSLLHENRARILAATGRPVAIHLGVRRPWLPLFRDDPRVDELVPLEQDHRQGGFRRTFGLAGVLRNGRYDAVLLGPPSLRAGLAAWLARVPRRVGYRHDGRSPFLNVGLVPQPRGALHYSREMVALGIAWFDALGLETDSLADRDFPVGLPGCDLVAPVDLGPGPPVWAVAPGTTYGEAKAWPLARLGDFIELATGRAGVRIVLLGDSNARGFTDRLCKEFPGSWSGDPRSGAAVVDLTGRTDLAAVVGILKTAAAFLGNDSGLMHLAAALGRPTVGVFGSSNPAWTSPRGPLARTVSAAGFSCRPCYRKTCNQPVFCLDKVAAETVLEKVLELVDREPNPAEES